MSTHLPDPENELVKAWLPLVRKVVARQAARMPRWIDRSEIHSLGLLGLLDAIRRRDPARSEASFTAFAVRCIQGKIISGLRSFYHLRNPLTIVSWDQLVGDSEKSTLHELIPDENSPDAAEVLAAAEETELAEIAKNRGLAKLKPQWREIAELRRAGLHMHEIGRRVGVTESGVSWILKAIRKTLKAA
jgi:RNA polymerase sigma factor (sigma-70 family)